MVHKLYLNKAVLGFFFKDVGSHSLPFSKMASGDNNINLSLPAAVSLSCRASTWEYSHIEVAAENELFELLDPTLQKATSITSTAWLRKSKKIPFLFKLV